jgi:hypothetical protein
MLPLVGNTFRSALWGEANGILIFDLFLSCCLSLGIPSAPHFGVRQMVFYLFFIYFCHAASRWEYLPPRTLGRGKCFFSSI